MRIYPVQSTYNKTQNTQKNNTYISNINFEGSSLAKISRPKLLNAHNEAVYEEICKLFNQKLLKGRKMLAPKLFTVDGINYGATWDQTNKNMNKLVLKDNINSKEDWEKYQTNQTIITGIFDNRGLIQEGSLVKTQPNGYNENAYFERKSPTGKRLRIEGLTLRVSRGSDEIWSTLPDHSYYRISSDINPKEYYKKIKLADLFFEIIRKNHAIF